MRGYRVSKDAERDLLSIFLGGLEQYGLRRAERYREALKRKFEMLAEFPDLTHTRPEWPASVRAIAFGSHVILYEQVDAGIVILRIRHGREDWLSQPPRGERQED